MCDATMSLLSENERELLQALIDVDVEFVIVGGARRSMHTDIALYKPVVRVAEVLHGRNSSRNV